MRKSYEICFPISQKNKMRSITERSYVIVDRYATEDINSKNIKTVRVTSNAIAGHPGHNILENISQTAAGSKIWLAVRSSI